MRVFARGAVWSLVVLFFAASVVAQQYTFTYYAGSPGGPGLIDDTGTAARFSAPQGIERDAAGNLYIADTMAHTIRVVSPAGVVTTFVGRWDDFGAEDGPRADARFFRPRDVTRDSAGNLYVVTDSAVRRITPLGIVSTLAAGFTNARGIAFDATTNSLFVTDGNHTVKNVTLAGVVTTFAGLAGTSGSANGTGSDIRFLNPTGIAVDSIGWVYVADGNHIIRRISPAGVGTTLAGTVGSPGHTNLTGTSARFNNPRGLAVDAAGYVYVADAGNNAVRKITPLGLASTLAGGTEGYLDAMTTSAKFNLPAAVAVDGSANVYVVEEENHTVRRIAADGTVTTIAGLGIVDGFIQGAVTSARFDAPSGMRFDLGGNMFLVDAFNHAIRKITPGAPATVALFAGGTAGGGDGTGAAAQFRVPNGVAIDGDDVLWVADTSNHTIRRITTTAGVTTFAGTAQMSGTTNATGNLARFNAPAGIAIDSADRLFVADTNNFAIRMITTSAAVSTFAGLAGTFGALDHATGTLARFRSPSDIVRDSTTGNFYVTDQNNYAIRKITPAAAVSTFAGGLGISSTPVDATGTDARFSQPRALSIDGSGNLYVLDTNVVRKITPGAVVTTIAGNRDLLGSEDGTGSVARFGSPSRIHAQADGTLFVADFLTHSIKRGTVALIVYATIDSATGPIDTARTLSSANHFLGVSYSWRIIRRPAGSTAALSSTFGRNPTFTPDVPDQYVFRQTATSIVGSMSITDVTLVATCSAVAVNPSSLPHPLVSTAYSQTLSASGGMGGTFQFAVSPAALPPGLTLSSSGTLSGTPTTTGDYTFTVVATGARGCSGVRTYTLTVGTLPPPTGLVATYNGPGLGVGLTWNAVPGASGYRIYRKTSPIFPYSDIGTIATTSFTDSAPVSAVALYRVRAYDGSSVESGDSNIDLATQYLTPDLVPGSTFIHSTHAELLRFVIDEALEILDQAVTPYFDPSLAGVTVKAVHLTQVRTRMNQVRTALGYSTLTFTDPSPSGVLVKAIHWEEVWNGLQ